MSEANVVINYENIINAIGEQIQDVWYALQNLGNTDEEKEIKKQISNIKAIEISDEQSFVRKREEKPLLQGTLYIVVRFGAGAINYGSSVTPISLYCVGTANKVKPSQLILGVFASTWTTKNLSQGLVDDENQSLEVKDALQVWNTPEIITNFNEIDNDFKNLFRLTGNIVVGPSAVRVGELTYYWGDGPNDFEKINVMSFQDGYRASLDSQPFGNTNGFAVSEVNFSTYTFTISTYLLNNHLTADILAIRGFRNAGSGLISSDLDPNEKVKIKIDFTNGFTNIYSGSDSFYAYFKIVSSQIGQELAGIPTLVIAFTR